MMFKVGDLIVDRHNPVGLLKIYRITQYGCAIGTRLREDSAYEFSWKFVRENFILKEIYDSPLYKAMNEEE